MLPFLCFLRFFLSQFCISVFRVFTNDIFRIQAYYATTQTDVDCVEGDEIEMEISHFDSISPAIMFVSASNLSNFQFIPTTEIHGFIEEPETFNCHVEELYAASSSSGNQTPEIGFSEGKYAWKFWSEEAQEAEEESDGERKTEEFIDLFSTGGEALGNSNPIFDESQMDSKFTNTEEKPYDNSESLPEVQILGEDFLFSSDSDSEAPSSDDDYSATSRQSISDEISGDGSGFKLQTDEEICGSGDGDSEKIDYIGDKFYVYDEYIELEPQIHFSTVPYARNSNLIEEDDGCEGENSIQNEDCSEKSKELKLEQDYGEDEMEFWGENQELIEQLKIEIRNSRTGGLPTILEEGEEEAMSPQLVQRLKPLKNDGKSEFKEELREIQRVYKMYADKMRKLDVLNTQTIHSIGLVKLKDPLSRSWNGGRKSGTRTAAIKSLISVKLGSGKEQKGSSGGTESSRLNSELELVYVGHVCLSWEILHWQHRKALQLQLHQNHSQQTQYNQVVNKFQLFCVLLQRFIEDEPFSCPRLQNYTESRRLLRSLLQVPPITEDCSNDKKMRGKEGENAISTGALVHIIEDSMWVFGEFVRSDKDMRNSRAKGAGELHQTDMMMEIRADLKKKEKRLKEIQRSRSCIVKKSQRNGEGRLNSAVFIAEIELRLVSRVMRMENLSEVQLLWCHKKLNHLNFWNGNVVLEPSFLLFPLFT